MRAKRIIQLFLIPPVLVLGALGSSAQKSLVVRAGVAMNNQLEGKFGTDGLAPGGVLSVGLINDFHKAFGAGVELNLVEKDAGYTLDSVDISDRNLYAELGVSVRYRKEWCKVQTYLTGGMLLSFWQGGKREPDTGLLKKEDAYLALPDARGGLDVGMYLGLGAEMARFMLEVRTYQGLMDISNRAYDKKALFNQGIQVTLGYRFGLD